MATEIHILWSTHAMGSVSGARSRCATCYVSLPTVSGETNLIRSVAKKTRVVLVGVVVVGVVVVVVVVVAVVVVSSKSPSS